eukprot:7390453-Prymnesium_polylepis.1
MKEAGRQEARLDRPVACLLPIFRREPAQHGRRNELVLGGPHQLAALHAGQLARGDDAMAAEASDARRRKERAWVAACLLYTSDAADDM